MTESEAGLDEFRLERMTWRDVEAATAETSTLLLPVGATEQHGHHMPLGVDTLMPEAIGERVAEEVPALLAPAVPYGVSEHHTFKPGTFTVESETFRRYVRDVAGSAAEWGIDNVLLLNGHYLAQDPELEVVVRDLRTEFDLAAFHVPLIDVFSDAAARVRDSSVTFHASEFETSLMLELFPDLVRMDEAEAVDPPAESLPLTDYDALGDNRVGWALTATDMAALTDTGNLGDPTSATAAKGRELADEAVENLVTLVAALERGDRNGVATTDAADRDGVADDRGDGATRGRDAGADDDRDGT
ncbi:creatininase family protein [Haloparvum alkalitolerans]|uniref:creatininase family protein n=1 Tax=Haloparvum alkalitolerans TaxID=1042953 RepID=UPI003CF0BE98